MSTLEDVYLAIDIVESQTDGVSLETSLRASQNSSSNCYGVDSI